jgi:hypothetical protein
MMKRYILAVAALAVFSITQADDCPWYTLGFCDAGKSVEDAATTVKEGMVESTTIAQSTINPFVQLIYWLHSGTDEQKKQARQILEGAFGMKVNPGDVPSFSVTFGFRNLDVTKAPLNVALIRTNNRLDDTQLAALVEQGEYQDLNFVPVVGKSPAIPDDFVAYQNDVSEVRKAVEANLAPYTYNRFDPTCRQTNLCSECSCSEWSNKPITDAISNAIMAVVDRKVHIAGSRPSATFNWTGERHLTLLIPESDLKAHPKLQVFMTIHPAQKIDTPLPDFVNNEKEIVIFKAPVVRSDKLIPSGTYRISRYELKG